MSRKAQNSTAGDPNVWMIAEARIYLKCTQMGCADLHPARPREKAVA